MSNTLTFSCTHSPFIKKGFLQHCIETYEKYNCTEVVHLGDLMDNHYSSFHISDPDGYGAKEEFRRSIKALHPWYVAFPNMKICIGNHDAIPQRKAFDAQISTVWVKTVEEVFDNNHFWCWEFADSWDLNGVQYVHGMGQKAKQRMMNEGQSVVQGHYHSESHINYHVTPKDILFAMQLGCGVDIKSYSMAYGKHFKKPIINCGVVFDDTMPLIVPMDM
jgi:hypothetical protein